MGSSKSKNDILREFIPISDIQNIILEYDSKLPYLKELNKKFKTHSAGSIGVGRDFKYGKMIKLDISTIINNKRHIIKTKFILIGDIDFVIPSISNPRTKQEKTQFMLFDLARKELFRTYTNHKMYYQKVEIIDEKLDLIPAVIYREN